MDTTDRLAAQQPLAVDLCGIIRIFGKALYNDFGAIVRELVQNGHDSVAEAYASKNGSAHSLPEYWVNVKYNQLELVVADNGTGMNVSGIAENLNNFGRSKKPSLPQNFSASDGGPMIIGMYGVGFLAAMAVSDRVDVWSQTASDPPVHWWYQNGETMAQTEFPSTDELIKVRQAHGRRLEDPRQPGTVVICRLSDDVSQEYDIDEATVRDSLVRYARLLRVPVYFNGVQVSDRLAGWSDPGRRSEADWKAMITETSGTEPLLVIPVSSPPDKLDLEGVLWIPPRQNVIGGNGQIDVYVRRLFVTQDDRLIRPSWARFVMGMVNSNKLNPMVSRSGLIEDKNVADVHEFVTAAILAAFNRLTAQPEDRYWEVIAEHDDIIKLSAAESDEFLGRVWNKLRVKVGVKRITLPQYLAEVKSRTKKEDVAYYYAQSREQFAAGMVSEAAGIPILSLWSLNDKEFVEAACRQQGISLRPYTELAAEVIKKPDDEQKYLPLMTACAAKKIAADIREYDPPHIPAMLVEDGSLQSRLQSLLSSLRQSPSPLDVQMGNQLQTAFFRQEALNRGVSFYLNTANPLIQELLTAPFETQQEACLALYNISYLSVAPNLQRVEIQAIYDSLCRVLRAMVEQTRPEPTPSRDPCRRTRLFMITPFAKEYEVVESAVRDVFENPPYFFEVVLARDFNYEFTMLDNLRTHMTEADGFVAEISDLNPNVLIELGAAVLGHDRSRPVIVLRGSEAKKKMPADIKGVLYINYRSGSEPKAIAAEIRQMIAAKGETTNMGIVGLVERQVCKALTETLLTSDLCRCREDEASQILQQYRTVEQFCGAALDDICRVTQVRIEHIEAIQNILKQFIL